MIRVWGLIFSLSAMFLPAIVSAQQIKANTNTSLTDVTVTGSATLIKAATVDRIYLSCTNSGSVNVRWGDATITTSKGQQLKTGLSIEIKDRGPVYMISEGANTTISCTEELR